MNDGKVEVRMNEALLLSTAPITIGDWVRGFCPDHVPPKKGHVSVGLICLCGWVLDSSFKGLLYWWIFEVFKICMKTNTNVGMFAVDFVILDLLDIL